MYKLKSHFPKFSKPLKHLLGKKQMLWSSLLGCHLTIHVTLDQIVHIADPLLWIWDLKQWSELYFLPSAPEDTKVINFVNTKHRIYYAICFIFNFTVIYYYIFIKNLISFQQERHNTYCVWKMVYKCLKTIIPTLSCAVGSLSLLLNIGLINENRIQVLFLHLEGLQQAKPFHLSIPFFPCLRNKYECLGKFLRFMSKWGYKVGLGFWLWVVLVLFFYLNHVKNI